MFVVHHHHNHHSKGSLTTYFSLLLSLSLKGIVSVKVLGILCMIDEGECDWKVVVIDAEDKWAPFLNDIDDVERELPGVLSAIREWYRTYKIPDGKPPNVFGLQERFMNKQYAMNVIEECHEAWKELLSGEKERMITEESDEVEDMIRNLSKNSLFDLAPNVDEHPTLRSASIIRTKPFTAEELGLLDGDDDEEPVSF